MYDEKLYFPTDPLNLYTSMLMTSMMLMLLRKIKKFSAGQ